MPAHRNGWASNGFIHAVTLTNNGRWKRERAEKRRMFAVSGVLSDDDDGG